VKDKTLRSLGMRPDQLGNEKAGGWSEVDLEIESVVGSG
jgi:hypothetical protein